MTFSGTIVLFSCQVIFCKISGYCDRTICGAQPEFTFDLHYFINTLKEYEFYVEAYWLTSVLYCKSELSIQCCPDKPIWATYYHFEDFSSWRMWWRSVEHIMSPGYKGTFIRHNIYMSLLFQINIVSVVYGRDVDGSLQCFQFVNQTEDRESCPTQLSFPHVMQECHNKAKCSLKISHESLLKDLVDLCPRIR